MEKEVATPLDSHFLFSLSKIGVVFEDAGDGDITAASRQVSSLTIIGNESGRMVPTFLRPRNTMDSSVRYFLKVN